MPLLLGLLACSTPPGSTSATTRALEVGLPHRPEAVVCDSAQPAEPVGCPDIDGWMTTCGQHADCGSDWCVASSYTGCYCQDDECDLDEDCGAYGACSCGSEGLWDVDRCLPSDCRVDADCPTGLCLATRTSCGGPDQAAFTGYHCATAQDTCRSDEVCTGEDELCVFDDGRFQCSSNSWVLFCDF